MKRWEIGCALLAVLFCLTACGQKRSSIDTVTLGDNMIHLYEVDGNTIARAAEDYQLKTPDAIASCVEDVMTALAALDSSKIEAYTYMMGEDNSLQLEMQLKEGTYENEDILLLMAATTETLFQLEDISSISLSVKNAVDEVCADQLFLRDTIYYYDAEENSLSQEIIAMYVPNAQGTGLESCGIKVQTEPQTSDQELIVRELVRKNVLPADTKVNQVSVHDSVCYLDLSAEFGNSAGTLSPEITLYALVDSVIAQTGVDTVQILIDGKIEAKYRNVVDINKPLPFNTGILQDE